MSTLGGLFETKPRCKRNFLLENIRDVRKERIKNSQSGNSLTLKHSQSHHRAPQPFSKLGSQNTHSKGASMKSLSSQTIQGFKQNNPPLANLRRQKSSGTQYHTDNGSQTTCELHGLCTQKDDCNLINCSRRVASPVCKYLFEENVPFRWTQVCPSVISHTLCHQSVQTLNEDDMNSLLEDGCIKYPTSDKTAGDEKDKGALPLEWTTYADEENSLPPESLTSQGKSTDPSISPVELNVGSSAKQNANCQLGEKKNLPAKYSLTNQYDELAPLPHRSRYPLSSKTNGEELSRKYNLQGIENKTFRDLRIDETELVKRQPRVKEPPLKSDLQLKSTLDKAETIEISTLSSNGLSSRPSTSYRKGVIPKYLVKRINERKALSKTTENNEINTLEEERRTALRKATKDFDALVAELNKMPVRTDTLRTKNRKIEIEKDLNVLERHIRALTRISDL